MNHWTQLSIEYANQRSYLDDLFQVYPTIPEGIRDIDSKLWKNVEIAFKKRDNQGLLKSLLDLELFPIKNSYVAYLRRDRKALERNPATVDRLCGRLYEMGIKEVYTGSPKPKETNTQIGPLFKRWLNKKALGIQPIKLDEFLKTKGNVILDASDAEMMAFARERLNYKHNKGLDFIGRFNGKYVIGEAKFLTDFGGHQNAQFNDAIATIKAKNVKAVKVAILDGVLYIKGKNKMYKDITGKLKEENIMSALVLREFLYQL
ncbi:MAG: restriction endonuclease [Candidatus Portnoybacteria bacterium]|nr:restriction endonuclease [Candidatus Portnoybacteria bacterium]